MTVETGRLQTLVFTHGHRADGERRHDLAKGGGDPPMLKRVTDASSTTDRHRATEGSSEGHYAVRRGTMSGNKTVVAAPRHSRTPDRARVGDAKPVSTPVPGYGHQRSADLTG